MRFHRAKLPGAGGSNRLGGCGSTVLLVACAGFATLPFAAAPTSTPHEPWRWTHFDTRLDNRAWSAWGTAREARLLNLRSGPHTFTVQAKSLFGRVDEAGATVSFEAAPPVYQHPAFLAVFALWVFSAFAAGLVYWRRRQRHQAEMQRERERAEEQLPRAQKLEALGVLASGIAHDFNNLLTSIVGYTGLVHDQLEDKPGERKQLQQVLKASHRAKDLVEQILAFSRHGKPRIQRFEVAKVFEEASRMLRATIPATIELRSSLPKTSAVVYGDPSQIHEVIVNLCTNAYQAMGPKAGLLELRLATVDKNATSNHLPADLPDGSYVELTVADNGPGIAAEVRARIFDPFFTTKSREKGTGLGFSVVHGIVRRHQGAITVESEIGRGASFHVYLPRLVGEAPEEIPESDSSGRGTERILFVDDEEALVQLARQSLERLGYRVSSYTDPHLALDAFRSGPFDFDLAVSDVTMPGLDGKELARRLMAIRPDLPVVLISGYSELISREEAVDMGVRELVAKPFDTKELASVMRRCLGENT